MAKTAKKAAKKREKVVPGSKPIAGRTIVGAEELPRRTLEDSLAIARVIHGTYAGKTATWDEIVTVGELGKTTNTKYLFWAAQAYGIILKEPAGQIFSLSENGRKIVAPIYEGEDREAVVKAILTPTLLSKFYTEYNGQLIPSSAHLPNLLETRYGIPRDRVAEAAEIIFANAAFAKILEESASGDRRINLSGASFSVPKSEAANDVNVADGLPGDGTRPTITGDWKKICFIITPIGSDGSEERRHADMTLKHLYGPVANDFSLTLVRADKIEKSGLISQQIFEHLARARICIADLSFNNPNVFYELGIRHMFKLPTVQIIRKGDKIPFDVAQGRTITIDTSDVYTVMDRFESARRELAEHVKNLISDSNGDEKDDNPVYVYLPGLRVTLTA